MPSEDTKELPQRPNMDVLNRAREAVLGYRPHSTQWIKVAMLIMDAWPSIYAMAKHLNEEVGLLRQAASGLPVAHLVEAPAGAHVVVHGVEVPTFPLGCAHDAERQRFVDAVNAAATQPAARPVDALRSPHAADRLFRAMGVDLDSLLRHREAFDGGVIDTADVRAVVEPFLRALYTPPYSTPEPAAQPVVQSFDFAAHLQRQAEFSAKTFGPGARVQMVSDHIAKELREVRDSNGHLSEWIDVIILALDGAWRSGASPQQIIDAIVAKQATNETRTWPDWRTADPNKAIEHDRSDEPAPWTPHVQVIPHDPQNGPW